MSAIEPLIQAPNWVPYVQPRICLSRDPRADLDLLEYQKSKLGTLLFPTYRWTNDGFVTEVDQESKIGKIAQLFSDCQVLKGTFESERGWEVLVHFPDRVSQAYATVAA